MMKQSAIGCSSAPASERVVEAVASAEGVDQTAIPPLYDSIDPEELDSVVRSADADGLRVLFEYAGYRVAVSGDGSIELTAQDD